MTHCCQANTLGQECEYSCPRVRLAPCTEYVIQDGVLGLCNGNRFDGVCQNSFHHSTNQEIDDWFKVINEQVKSLEAEYQRPRNSERGDK